MGATEGTLEEVLAGAADWCVVEGDCLEVLPTIPDKAVAHVIMDAPYIAAVHSKQRSGNNPGANRELGFARHHSSRATGPLPPQKRSLSPTPKAGNDGTVAAITRFGTSASNTPTESTKHRSQLI